MAIRRASFPARSAAARQAAMTTALGTSDGKSPVQPSGPVSPEPSQSFFTAN